MTTAEVLLIKEDVLTIYTEGDEESKAHVIELPEEVFFIITDFTIQRSTQGMSFSLTGLAINLKLNSNSSVPYQGRPSTPPYSFDVAIDSASLSWSCA